MKLAMCKDCYDVFKLDYAMRQCKCGKIKGRYIDNVNAEVSRDAISIALGNGAVEHAYARMLGLQAKTQDTAKRGEYYEAGAGGIAYAWVRPNSGPGNPHTKVIEDTKE